MRRRTSPCTFTAQRTFTVRTASTLPTRHFAVSRLGTPWAAPRSIASTFHRPPRPLRTPQRAARVRQELVNRIRAQIAAGTYETPQKLDAAVDRLLDEIG